MMQTNNLTDVENLKPKPANTQGVLEYFSNSESPNLKFRFNF